MLLTRFNLPTPGIESLIRAREGWLRERVVLFERYCAPSVAGQTHPNLDWIVYFDPQSPDWLVQRLRPLAEAGLFRPVYRSAVTVPELVSDVREVVRDKQDVLITTNLDNDDGLALDFSERLIAMRLDHPRAAVYMSRGLIKSPGGVYLRRDPRNAFVSVREPWDSPVTSWGQYHNEFHRVMPTVEIGGQPGWLQVVHGSNVSNRVRGRLVAPQAYPDLFGHSLDDSARPSRWELGADAIVRHPTRTVRDAGRALLRRAGLGLLGKEGYGRAKLAFVSVRGRTH